MKTVHFRLPITVVKNVDAWVEILNADETFSSRLERMGHFLRSRSDVLRLAICLGMHEVERLMTDNSRPK